MGTPVWTLIPLVGSFGAGLLVFTVEMGNSRSLISALFLGDLKIPALKGEM